MYALQLHNKVDLPVSAIARAYGMSAVKFNRLLADKGIQHKQGDQWILSKEFQGMGYTLNKPLEIQRGEGWQQVRMTTRWTQGGRLFLYERLKADGILPISGRNSSASCSDTDTDTLCAGIDQLARFARLQKWRQKK